MSSDSPRNAGSAVYNLLLLTFPQRAVAKTNVRLVAVSLSSHAGGQRQHPLHCSQREMAAQGSWQRAAEPHRSAMMPRRPWEQQRTLLPLYRD